MESHRYTLARGLAGMLLVLAASQVFPSAALGETAVLEKEDFSLGIGLRVQSRLELAPTGTKDWQRDFSVRRARVKVNGKVLDAQYKIEWKIDGTDRIGTTPSAAVENGYIQWPLGAGVQLRGGLYDQPFSRDRLTSDSNQLVVDRSEVSNVPDALGLADNAIGVQVMGKVQRARVDYTVGLFDNRNISGPLQDWPMVVGRLDFNFGSSKDVFRDTHFGEGSWYCVGVNGSFQGGLENAGGADDGENTAAGIDGMFDVPAGNGRLTMRGEVNRVGKDDPGPGNSVDTTVWMVGLGYLFWDERLQPVVRFDQVHRDEAVGGGTQDVTYVGLNLYRKGHNLKFQGDLRFEGGTGRDLDGIRLQGQVDF